MSVPTYVDTDTLFERLEPNSEVLRKTFRKIGNLLARLGEMSIDFAS